MQMQTAAQPLGPAVLGQGAARRAWQAEPAGTALATSVAKVHGAKGVFLSLGHRELAAGLAESSSQGGGGQGPGNRPENLRTRILQAFTVGPGAGAGTGHLVRVGSLAWPLAPLLGR